jgi:DNA-binding winged helix-turn-helix (wHTH) protein
LTKPSYKFGPFLLDPVARRLLCDETPVAITPKCFDLLTVLVENSGHLLEKEALLKRVWPNQFVEESNLSFNISTLRKALDAEALECAWKRGKLKPEDIQRRREISRNQASRSS